MWSFAITLGVYAFGVGGAALVGVAGLIRLLPCALASPFGGLLGDRHSRRAVLLLSAVCCSVVLAGSALAVALDAPAAVVFALAGLWTVASSLYVPAEGALTTRWGGGRDFYVVLEGDMRAEVNREVVGRMGVGDFFGELAALDWGAGYGYARLATVTADSSARLLLVPPDVFNHLVAEAPAFE